MGFWPKVSRVGTVVLIETPLSRSLKSHNRVTGTLECTVHDLKVALRPVT